MGGLCNFPTIENFLPNGIILETHYSKLIRLRVIPFSRFCKKKTKEESKWMIKNFLNATSNILYISSTFSDEYKILKLLFKKIWKNIHEDIVLCLFQLIIFQNQQGSKRS